ncbi:MAG: hypothetical protein AAF335_03215 [Bacteroidota bacterium]
MYKPYLSACALWVVLTASSTTFATTKATTGHPTLDQYIEAAIENAFPDTETAQKEIIKNFEQLLECGRQQKKIERQVKEKKIEEQFKLELKHSMRFHKNDRKRALIRMYELDHSKDKNEKKTPKGKNKKTIPNLTEQEWEEKILKERKEKKGLYSEEKKIDTNIENALNEYKNETKKKIDAFHNDINAFKEAKTNEIKQALKDNPKLENLPLENNMFFYLSTLILHVAKDKKINTFFAHHKDKKLNKIVQNVSKFNFEKYDKNKVIPLKRSNPMLYDVIGLLYMKAGLTTTEADDWTKTNILNLKKAAREDLSAFMQQKKNIADVFENAIEKLKFLAIFHTLYADTKIEDFLTQLPINQFKKAPDSSDDSSSGNDSTTSSLFTWGRGFTAVFIVGIIITAAIFWQKSQTKNKLETQE